MATMNDRYGDGSDHECCVKCGFCISCGDCEKYGCGSPMLDIYERETCSCGDEDCDYQESKFYWHEALDRAHLACDFFYEYVETHPAIAHDAELKERAEKVTDTIQQFYQLVGSRRHGTD